MKPVKNNPLFVVVNPTLVTMPIKSLDFLITYNFCLLSGFGIVKSNPEDESKTDILLNGKSGVDNTIS